MTFVLKYKKFYPEIYTFFVDYTFKKKDLKIFVDSFT